MSAQLSVLNPRTGVCRIYIKMARKCLQHASYFQILVFCYIRFCISLSRLVNFWSFKQRGAVPTRCTVKCELYCYNY